jgi:hypothetical protein
MSSYITYVFKVTDKDKFHNFQKDIHALHMGKRNLPYLEGAQIAVISSENLSDYQDYSDYLLAFIYDQLKIIHSDPLTFEEWLKEQK